ncbi:MAG: hypothetical protein O7J95_08490 [Planctomycetota bacterium]|nr:hypothetical protein [Planctomycetota bacterium]
MKHRLVTLSILSLLCLGLAGFSPTAEASDRSSRFRFSLGVGGRGGHFRVDFGSSRGRYGRRLGHYNRRYEHRRGHGHGSVYGHRYGRSAPPCRVYYDKVHVPPTYERVVVGHDHHGLPVYDEVLVSSGYYRTVKRYACRVRGHHHRH